MNAEEFLKRLNSITIEARAPFSGTVLNLSKLSCAEAVKPMLNDSDFGVRINALKAIRKYELDIYEKEIIALLIDQSQEVQVAAIKTLSSFGKSEHFKLVKAFYDENTHLRAMIVDSFVNYSDLFDAHKLMFELIDSGNERLRKSAIDWFSKALTKEIFSSWIIKLYEDAPFTLRWSFEERFALDLKPLFDDKTHGYRFKLIYLARALNEQP